MRIFIIWHPPYFVFAGPITFKTTLRSSRGKTTETFMAIFGTTNIFKYYNVFLKAKSLILSVMDDKKEIEIKPHEL